MRLCRPRQWGACWLAGVLWRELRLDRFWAERLPKSRKGTRWDHVLQVLATYRLIAPGSEWRLHRQWFLDSAMADLLGVRLRPGGSAQTLCLPRPAARPQTGFVLASDRALARSVQRLVRRAALRSDQHLFRGQRLRLARGQQAPPRLQPRQAARLPASSSSRWSSRRRACRSPTRFCPATPPTARRCGRSCAKIESQYGKARRVWVMDRGVPTEEVLAEMRASDPPVSYLVGTPKGRLTAPRKASRRQALAQGARGRRGQAAGRRTTSSMSSPRAPIASAKSARCGGGN